MVSETDSEIGLAPVRSYLPEKRLVDLILEGQGASTGVVDRPPYKNQFSDLLLSKYGPRLIESGCCLRLLIWATNFNFNSEANYYNNLKVN